VSRLVASADDLDGLLRGILELGSSVVRAEAAAVLLVRGKGRELVFAAATGEKGDALRRITLAHGEGIAGWVLRHNKPLLVPGAEADVRWSGRVDELVGFTTRSVACVPLRVQDKTICVMEMVNKIDEDTFTQADLDLLSSLASQAALLI